MSDSDTSKFQIFRAADAKDLMEEGCMTVEPFTPVQREGMDKLVAAGFMDGDEVKVLVNIPGFSLTHVWFKKDYPYRSTAMTRTACITSSRAASN